MSIQNVTGVHLMNGVPAVVAHERDGTKWVSLDGGTGGARIDIFYDDIDTLRAFVSKMAFAAADLERGLRVAAEPVAS